MIRKSIPFRFTLHIVSGLACLILLSAALPFAASGQEEVERLQALHSGSVAERRNALNWLARNGKQDGAAAIVDSLRDEDGQVRALAEDALWAIWSRSGNRRVDELLRKGGSLMASGRLWQAVEFFDEIISEMPAFAEGYNKRATAWYLMGAYDRSLADIELTLKRNPYHFGALSGAGYCMIRLQRYGEAIAFLRRALKINPNLESVRVLSSELEKTLRRNSI